RNVTACEALAAPDPPVRQRKARPPAAVTRISALWSRGGLGTQACGLVGDRSDRALDMVPREDLGPDVVPYPAGPVGHAPAVPGRRLRRRPTAPTPGCALPASAPTPSSRPGASCAGSAAAPGAPGN